MHRLREAKGPSFEQLPVRGLARLVREGQGLSGGIDRRPPVLPGPLSADQPPLVEELDIAAPIDFAHEVKAACSQRHPGSGEVRERATQVGRQPWTPASQAQLRGRFARQPRRAVMIMIPGREAPHGPPDVRQRGENLARSKGATPQRVKRLDLVVAFGVVARGKEGLDATPQAQPHDPPDDPTIEKLSLLFLHCPSSEFCSDNHGFVAIREQIHVDCHPDSPSCTGGLFLISR